MVLMSHEMQTPDRLRDVKNNKVNRLKIQDQISLSLSNKVMQHFLRRLMLYRGKPVPVQIYLS